MCLSLDPPRPPVGVDAGHGQAAVAHPAANGARLGHRAELGGYEVVQPVQGRAAAGEPVVSVDTKKKELVGRYANGGAEWQPAGEPERVGVHDFPDPKVGKAIPYGSGGFV
jgi:hypothetical protein